MGWVAAGQAEGSERDPACFPPAEYSQARRWFRWAGLFGAFGIWVGATVQFHVRDPASADQDLRTMLGPYSGRAPAGALLFGCNGRGTRMWDIPGHDVNVLREIVGDVPVAGFFCGGEFGPVGGTNFVHAFTASIALFRSPDDGPTQLD